MKKLLEILFGASAPWYDAREREAYRRRHDVEMSWVMR